MVGAVLQLSEIGYLVEVMVIATFNLVPYSAFRLQCNKSRKCTSINIYCGKIIKYFIALSGSSGYSEQICSQKCQLEALCED
jgi:uncharacterized membrane protein YiaA